MSKKILNARLALNRMNEAEIDASKVLLKGEILWVDTADGLKYKVGDGTSTFEQLEYNAADSFTGHDVELTGSLALNAEINPEYPNTVNLGYNNENTEAHSFATGDQTQAGWRSHAEGYLTKAVNTGHAEGRLSQALGKGSHAEGKGAVIDFSSTTALEEDVSIDSNTIKLSHYPEELQIGTFIQINPNEEQDFVITDAKRVENIELSEEEKTLFFRTLLQGNDFSSTNGSFTGLIERNSEYYYDPNLNDYYWTLISETIMDRDMGLRYIEFNNNGILYPITNIEVLSINEDMYGTTCKIEFDGDYIPKVGEYAYFYKAYTPATLTLNSPFRAYNYDETCTPDNSGIIPAGAIIKRQIPPTASGDTAHTEGEGTLASGANSHAQGHRTEARGWSSHAEGNQSKSIATYGGHAEGYETIVAGNYGHAEGHKTTIKSSSSYGHAEGEDTVVEGWRAHAEGWGSKAIGANSHAEGRDTEARGGNSHTGGKGTIAIGDNQTVIGRYNITDNSKAFIVGNGNSNSDRSNAFSIDWDGNLENTNSIKFGPYIAINEGHTTTSIIGIQKNSAEEEYFRISPFTTGSKRNDMPSNGVEVGLDNIFINDSNLYDYYTHIDQYGLVSVEGYGNESARVELVKYNEHSYNKEAAKETIIMPDAIRLHDNADDNLYLGNTNGNGQELYIHYGENGNMSIRYNGIYANGKNLIKPGSGQHSVNEGYNNTVSSFAGHVEGGENTVETSYYGHAEGCKTKVTGMCGHAEGRCTQANGIGAHAEGSNYNKSGAKDDTGYLSKDGTTNIIGSIASSHNSHAEGFQTHAKGFSSHAEGYRTYASGEHSHAEGEETQTIGGRSHAEGRFSIAEGWNSHAEGARTWAKGESAHAEGNRSEAHGTNSHAAGLHTIATGNNQTVIGKYNKTDANKAFIIGGGDSDTDRKNIFTVDWEGNVEGKIKIPDHIKPVSISLGDDGSPPEGSDENAGYGPPSDYITIQSGMITLENSSNNFNQASITSDEILMKGWGSDYGDKVSIKRNEITINDKKVATEEYVDSKIGSGSIEIPKNLTDIESITIQNEYQDKTKILPGNIRVSDVIRIGTDLSEEYYYPPDIGIGLGQFQTTDYELIISNGDLYGPESSGELYYTHINSAGITTNGNITAANYPAYTEADEGKVLMIKNGTPTWVTLSELLSS